MVRYDETTLAVDGQREYSLPVGVSDDVRRVEVIGLALRHTILGGTIIGMLINRKLLFDEGSEPDGDYRIRLYFNDPLASLVDDDDALPADVPQKAWYTGGVYYCLKERLRKTKQGDAVIMALLGRRSGIG